MDGFFATNLGMLLVVIGQCLLITIFLLVSAMFLVYGDRKIWGAVQMRRGPNVVGPWGLLQLIADFVKYIVKEVLIPAGSDKTVFLIAPLLAFVLPLIMWAVIPFNETWILSDLNVAVLYIFAIGSLEVYGVDYGWLGVKFKIPIPRFAPVCRANDLIRGLNWLHYHRDHYLHWLA